MTDTARPRQVLIPTTADLARAAAVVARHLRPTPVIEVERPDGGRLALKVETLQPTGAFKVRGALAALDAYAALGLPVVTASAGNHGLGVAHASALLGVPARIVVPRTASPAKVDSLRRLGADLVLYGDGYDEAEKHALELAEQGAAYVSAYNDPHVIAGQGTCVAEIADQVAGETTVIVPVGGGGLIAGTVLAASNRIRVVGVEAAASRAVSTAVAAGRVVQVPIGATLADGLAGNLEAGCVTPTIAAGRVHEFLAVTEAEIAAAVRFLVSRCGLVVEGSGAVGVAAVLAGKVDITGTPVAILTGRNIATQTLLDILAG